MDEAMQLSLKEIDLSQTSKDGGAGLEAGPTYLVLYGGSYYVGSFSTQWYGLNFNGIYDAGAQYDPPGNNYSEWQRIWRLDNAEEISRAAEPEYMRSRRAYAIRHLVHGGRKIDETAPLEAFAYNPTVPVMPEAEDD